MRLTLLFTALLGCSGGAPATPPQISWPPRPRVDAGLPVDASLPLLAARGEACREPAQACAAELSCTQAPGGYCASPCGLGGAVCPDGVCVATARSGEQCLRGCARDADCRTAEGYVCDGQWRACLIPNSAVIVPKQCPAAAGLARDKAFGATAALTNPTTPGLAQNAPSAIITDSGNIVAEWSSYSGGRPQVRLARDAKGILYAVWVESEGHHRQISLARSRDSGKTWTGPDRVDAADCTDREPACLDRPMLAIGADRIYVLYAASGGIRVATSFDEGNSFRTGLTALVGHHGSATVGADGRLHIIALDPATSLPGFGSADHRILYTVSADRGASFAKAQRVSGRDEMLPFYVASPGVAVDTKRKWIYTVYVRGGRDAVWDLVIAATKDNGKTWKRTRIGDDLPGCAIHMVPTLALDATTGTLHVAWYDNRDGGRFARATCTPGAVKCTQQGAINDQPFAAFTAEHGTARSLGEAAALVIDAKRRVLHAVWAQPFDEQGKIVTRIVHAQAALPKK
ncbi:MAG: exo-alpha-sialidase [Deltaproteobacteria bacterium]|nr:exo-alpha-sialidase [Deltaproteobacteria bacterium]